MAWDLEVKDGVWEALGNEPFMLKKYVLNVSGSFITMEQKDIFWIWKP